MKRRALLQLAALTVLGWLVSAAAARPEAGSDAHAAARLPGSGTVSVRGELKQWHKVTLDLDGPFANERDTDPNPFTDYRLTALFRHPATGRRYVVPGYFAADGRAGGNLRRCRILLAGPFRPGCRGPLGV